MYQREQGKVVSGRGASSPEGRKAWVRPSVSLVAASSAEAGVGPFIDGGDNPDS